MAIGRVRPSALQQARIAATEKPTATSASLAITAPTSTQSRDSATLAGTVQPSRQLAQSARLAALARSPTTSPSSVRRAPLLTPVQPSAWGARLVQPVIIHPVQRLSAPTGRYLDRMARHAWTAREAWRARVRLGTCKCPALPATTR